MPVARAAQSTHRSTAQSPVRNTAFRWAGAAFDSSPGASAARAPRACAPGACESPAVGAPSTGEARGIPKISTSRAGGAADGRVSTTHCIISGIDSEATSTTVHAVICTRGSRIRSSFKPNQTMPPSTSDRSAASNSSANITFCPLPASPDPSACAIACGRASRIHHSDQDFSTEPLQNQSTTRWTALAATRPRASVA